MSSLKLTIILFLNFFSCYSLFSEHFLSFVMPCYNCSDTIRDSIDSLYQQNLQIPFEVICTDDGSTDNTLAILYEYKKKYSNLHVLVHERNLGGGAANNTCVSYARGDLLFRLDSDNILPQNSVQKLIDLLDETGCAGAAFQEIRFFTKNDYGQKVHKNSCFYQIPDNIADLTHAFTNQANPIASGNYLYTRESFDKAGGYPIRHGSDTHCFGLKQYLTGSKIAILPNTFYWHFYNDKGYFCREEKTGNNRIAVWETLKQYLDLFNERTKDYIQGVNFQETDPWLSMEQGKIQLK